MHVALLHHRTKLGHLHLVDLNRQGDDARLGPLGREDEADLQVGEDRGRAKRRNTGVVLGHSVLFSTSPHFEQRRVWVGSW